MCERGLSRRPGANRLQAIVAIVAQQCCIQAGHERIQKELTGFELLRIALQNGVTENLHNVVRKSVCERRRLALDGWMDGWMDVLLTQGEATRQEQPCITSPHNACTTEFK